MATIKSYTDISQSKTLSKILPIESADMWWNFYSVTTDNTTPQIIHIDTPWVGSFNWNNKPDNIPCWSLAALLSVLPTIDDDEFEPQLHRSLDKYRCTYEGKEDSSGLWRVADNPVDACYEMILKLHELNLL